MHFPFILYDMMLLYKWQYTDKTLTLRKCMYMRDFHILKLLFLSIFCRYNRYFVGTNGPGMLVGLHVSTNFQNIPTNTNIEQMYVYASELRKFWYFYILTLLFLSIFCRYSRYFVGTNDMLVGLHVPTNFLIYRQTLTLSKCMCMRLSGASELRKFWQF